MTPSINPIKDALIAVLKAHAVALGLKSVQQDFNLEDIKKDVEKLVPVFPAVAVVYYGRGGVLHGQVLETDPHFAVILAHRSLSAPHAADPTVTDLIDKVAALIDYTKPSDRMARTFSFVSDTLLYKDNLLTVYQLIFSTQVLDNRKPVPSS